MAATPLSPQQEQLLARQARAGDREARAALITSGLRSVALRARMLGLRGEELRDAVQSGAVGLIRAVDRFDPDRGVRLSTYAWRWIGAEMIRAASVREVPLGELDPSADVPVGGCGDLLDALPEVESQVVSMRFGLASQGACPMTREAVADRLGLTISQVRTLEGKAMRQLRRGLAKVADRAPHQ
jgi:DNA-directed RNA polymerase sigma subunit (sigma70/sigma32)